MREECPWGKCPRSMLDVGSLPMSAMTSQSALELSPDQSSHCPNEHLGQDLGFCGFAFAIMLPKLLKTNLVTVREKLGQTSPCPNGP